MTNIRAALPSAQTPVISPGGLMTTPWYDFCIALFRRTGGVVDGVGDLENLLTIAATAEGLAGDVARLRARIAQLEGVINSLPPAAMRRLETRVSAIEATTQGLPSFRRLEARLSSVELREASSIGI